jgi:poly(A) polymerase
VSLGERLAASVPLRVAREALGDESAWIVGGALRDALLGRPFRDIDLSVEPGGERAVARTVAAAAGGHAFIFSREWRTWRAAWPDGAVHVDVTPVHAESIEDDLRCRDFTVNSMALEVRRADASAKMSDLIDPFGGAPDADAGVLRATSPESFSADPLRVLRAARLVAELGFDVAEPTIELARAEAPRAGEPAGERQLAELAALLAAPRPVAGLETLDHLRATPAVLPEVHALHGVEQNPYHHLDVHGHTVEVLERLLAVERDLDAYAGEHAEAVGEVLGEPLADGLTRGEALRMGALFHDLGKPETRSIGEDGRILFIGHDRAGAGIVGDLCRRLRTSRRLRGYLQGICLHHLRLGFLVHERPLSRRSIYEYLVATDPDSACVTLLTIADRLATQGEKTRREAIDSHLELARKMLGEALEWRRAGRPRAPVAGDELAAALGIEPGPELGRLLRELEAARFAGEVTTREDAIEFARALRGKGGASSASRPGAPGGGGASSVSR